MKPHRFVQYPPNGPRFYGLTDICAVCEYVEASSWHTAEPADEDD